MIQTFRTLRRKLAHGRIGFSLIFGLSILFSILAFSLIGPLFVDVSDTLVGAMRPRRPPSSEYFLGTDAQGRDMWAMLIYATPNTLKMGLIAGVVGVGFGSLLGLVAGHFGGIIDSTIRIISDALLNKTINTNNEG
jgi:peptide/nickel transport system permease protein